MAATPTNPTVLLVTRDPEVKQVANALQADGLTCRGVGSTRELQRALNASKSSPVVAILDAEMLADAAFADTDLLERLRNLPILILLPADGDPSLGADAQRTSVEEYARKPIPTSVLALRTKALILTAGMSLPTNSGPQSQVQQGPL